MFQVVGSNIVVAVIKLNIFSKRAVCWPLLNGHIDTDTTLNIDISKLQSTNGEILNVLDKQLLSNIKSESITDTIHNMSRDMKYRKTHRKMQLAGAILAEVKATLTRRQRAHHAFNLGLCVPDVDPEVLGLDIIAGKSRIRFAYKVTKSAVHISTLDELLGERWDISSGDNITAFVTSLSIAINIKSQLTVSLSVATCSGTVCEGNYRVLLSRHMAHVEDSLEGNDTHN